MGVLFYCVCREQEQCNSKARGFRMQIHSALCQGADICLRVSITVGKTCTSILDAGDSRQVDRLIFRASVSVAKWQLNPEYFWRKHELRQTMFQCPTPIGPVTAGQEGEQGIGYPSTSLPTRVHQGTFQEVARMHGSASLPSASYQRSSIDQQAHMQSSNGGIHVDNTQEDLLSLDRQSDGDHQMLAFLGNVGRAASAPRERMRPDVRKFPVQPSTPLEQGSELQAMYTHAGEIGSQLAAQYMREAEQTSRNSYTTPPTPGGNGRLLPLVLNLYVVPSLTIS